MIVLTYSTTNTSLGAEVEERLGKTKFEKLVLVLSNAP